MRFSARHWQRKASVLGLPMMLGGLWAGLWALMQVLAAGMDAMQGKGDGFLYGLGQAATFRLFLAAYVGATILPALGWYLVWRNVKEEPSPKMRAITLLGGMMLPVIVGLIILAAGSAYSPWMKRAWADWHNLHFVTSQIMGMSMMVWFASYLVRRKESNKQG